MPYPRSRQGARLVGRPLVGFICRPAFLLVAALSAFACSAGGPAPSAETVTTRFWTEISEGDLQAATARCVAGTRIDAEVLPATSLIGVDAGNGSDLAMAVPTRLKLPTAGQPAEITTYLERSDAASPWAVDCTRTIVQLQVRVEVDAMVERVRTLSDTLSEEMARGTEQLKRTLPALEEGLGRELERMEAEVMQAVPEFMKRLEEFSRAIDESLNKLPGRSAPPAPEGEPGTGPGQPPATDDPDSSADPEKGPTDPIAV